MSNEWLDNHIKNRDTPLPADNEGLQFIRDTKELNNRPIDQNSDGMQFLSDIKQLNQGPVPHDAPGMDFVVTTQQQRGQTLGGNAPGRIFLNDVERINANPAPAEGLQFIQGLNEQYPSTLQSQQSVELEQVVTQLREADVSHISESNPDGTSASVPRNQSIATSPQR